MTARCWIAGDSPAAGWRLCLRVIVIFGVQAHAMPLTVAAMLLGIHHFPTGAPVFKQALGNDKAAVARFATIGHVANRRSTLLFEIEKDSVTERTRYPGGHYKSNVTVMFDSDL